MDNKPNELESKYARLAAEYSKIRSHATVLKKAVLDEQSKILDLKETVKEQEMQIRKHNQEMESLTFRNEQLTKRISFLQQELQGSQQNSKKGSKSRNNDVHAPLNISVLDEELHKKILENATLVSQMADKDFELSNSQDRVEYLEGELNELRTKMTAMTVEHKQEIVNLKQTSSAKADCDDAAVMRKREMELASDKCDRKSEVDNSDDKLKEELEALKRECELLKLKPVESEDVDDFYSEQIKSLLLDKQLAQSEAGILWADNNGLLVRLEHLILEKNALESILEKSNEELHTTSQNYKLQLDAMTEHIAMQNERITKLSDEVEYHKHKLNAKK